MSAFKLIPYHLHLYSHAHLSFHLDQSDKYYLLNEIMDSYLIGFDIIEKLNKIKINFIFIFYFLFFIFYLPLSRFNIFLKLIG